MGTPRVQGPKTTVSTTSNADQFKKLAAKNAERERALEIQIFGKVQPAKESPKAVAPEPPKKSIAERFKAWVNEKTSNAHKNLSSTDNSVKSFENEEKAIM